MGSAFDAGVIVWITGAVGFMTITGAGLITGIMIGFWTTGGTTWMTGCGFATGVIIVITAGAGFTTVIGAGLA
jgi:hypothetical protein